MEMIKYMFNPDGERHMFTRNTTDMYWTLHGTLQAYTIFTYVKK